MPFTIHLSSPSHLRPELLDALAGRPLLGRVERAMAVAGDRGGTAADAASRLIDRLGWGTLHPDSLDIADADDLTDADVAAARTLGGAIRAVVVAELSGNGRDGGGGGGGGARSAVRAFAGPAFLSLSEPLASIDASHHGIRLDGGPMEERVLDGTRWLIRITFPGVVPSDDTVRALVEKAGIAVERIEGSRFSTTSRWLLAGIHTRAEVDAALACVSHAHRLSTASFRRF